MCFKSSSILLRSRASPKTWIQWSFYASKQIQYLALRAMCPHNKHWKNRWWGSMSVLQQPKRYNEADEIRLVGTLTVRKMDTWNFFCAWFWQSRDIGFDSQKTIQKELLRLSEVECRYLYWLWLQGLPQGCSRELCCYCKTAKFTWN